MARTWLNLLKLEYTDGTQYCDSRTEHTIFTVNETPRTSKNLQNVTDNVVITKNGHYYYFMIYFIVAILR